MILRRLALRNFRRYRRAEFVFPEGLVGIIGPNGSGKSTIFEAVGWALFGNSHSRTGGYGLASTQAGAGAPCSAELEFEAAGCRYRVLRRLTYGGEFTWAQVFEDGEVAATGAEASRLIIRRVVGVQPSAFLKTVHARQGELGGLARDTLGYRRRFMEELLSLDWLDRARHRVASDREAVGRILSPKVREVPDEDRDLEGLREQAVREIGRLREESQARALDLETSERLRTRYLTLMAEVDVLEKSLAKLNGALSERERSIVALRGPPQETPLEESVLAQIAKERGRESAVASQLSRLSRALEALVGTTSSRCPVCGGPLPPESRRQIECERRRLARELDSLGVARRALTRRLEEAGRQRRRAEQAAAVAREVQRMQAERSIVEERLVSFRAEQAALGFDPAAHEDATKYLRELEGKLRDKIYLKAELEGRLSHVKVLKDETLRQVEGQERHSRLHCLEKLLADFRTSLVDGFLPVFERECSELVAAATEGRYTKVLLDREFNLRMQDGGRTYVLGRFSGGEQDVACLAIRLGLLRLISRAAPIEFAVLDEVFGSQDRLRRRTLLSALGRLCPPFRQIFVVTHAEDVQELLPQTLQLGMTLSAPTVGG